MEASARSTPLRRVHLIRRQREKIEQELSNICHDIVQLLDDYLLPHSGITDDEEQVFYRKM
jgi:14-3-3 protein epsilon